MKIFTSLKFVLAAMLLTVGSTMMADEITFTFSNPDYPKSSSEATDGDNPTITEGVITLVGATAESQKNQTRIWGADGTLRIYKGSTVTLKSSGEPITQIIWTAKASSNNHLTAEGAVADGKLLTWTGSAQEVVFTNDDSANSQYTQVVVVVGGETPPPPTPTDKIYEKAMLNDEAGFIPNNVSLAEGLTYVWKNNNYGWVASAFANEQAYEAESWLVSPRFDVEAGSTVTLSFDHAMNKGTADAISLMVSSDKENWTAVTIPSIPAGTDWNFIPSGDIDLSSFAGKTLYIAFKYKSTADNAPSWEIQNFLLKGKGTVTSEKVYTTYTSLSAVKAGATDTKAGAVLQLNNLLVTYINGANIYVTDGNEGFLLYGKTELKAGDIISGSAKGDLYLYHALPELAIETAEGITVVSSDNEVTPKSLEELSEVSSVSVAMPFTSMLVTIPDFYVEAETLTEQAVNLLQEGESVTLYDQFKLLNSVTFNTSKAYTATFIVSVRDDKVQLYPVSKAEWEDEYTFVGQGTQDDPYTVADAIHLFDPNQATGRVWVKGIIVGCANGSLAKCAFAAGDENIVNTNILIADVAGETTVGKCVPVNLPNETAYRTNLNLVDHVENIGKEVLLWGTVEKYFSVAGIKNLGEAIIDGVSVGIETVNTEAVRTLGIYTLAGQRVENVTRGGLYIIGGKKVLVK